MGIRPARPRAGSHLPNRRPKFRHRKMNPERKGIQLMRARALIGLIASAFLAAPAGATGIAGWDFSQYLGTSLLSTDGATFTNTLSANYSQLDPTFNAGA